MKRQKKLMIGLLGLLVLLATVAGMVWNRKHYVLVDFRFYPKNEQILDLREQEIPASRIDKLEQKLPQCEILWTVPLSGGSVSSDVQTLRLTTVTREDAELIFRMKELKRVDAKGCSDYENLLTLENLCPELDVRYSVALGRGSFDHDAEEIIVDGVTGAELSCLDNMKQLESVVCAGAESSAAVMLQQACAQRGIAFCVQVGGQRLDWETVEVQAEEVTDAELFLLASLPQLKKVHIIRPQATAQQMQNLVQNNPQLTLTWEAEIGGKLYPADAEELDLSEGTVTDLEQLKASLEWFPNVKEVFLGKCGIDNETLAAFREEKRQDYKVVWTVQLGKELTARTDDTTFMPVREHVYYFNDEEAYNLRYCEEMVCIDIGHMSIHNIDFVQFMPDLTYLILAHTQLNYIDPISSCKNLKFLELDWSPVRDLSPLVGCTALEDLNLGNTFASFEPIKQMTWLKNLWVIDCSGGTAYKMSQALPDTKVQGSGSATVDSGWRDLDNYYAMRDVLGMHYMSW